MSYKLDKEKIAGCFRRARTSYDHHGVVQKTVGDELVESLSTYPEITYNRVLEVGCCTGMMTEELCRRFPINTLYVNDLVPEFQQTVFDRIPQMNRPRFEWLFGDIEEINLPANLDLAVSSATIQWLEDLAGFFKKIYSSLVDNGYLVFSIFGPGTLEEFRILTGIGLNYYELDNILNTLEKNFKVKAVESRKEKLYFPTAHLVLKHFQATGVGGVSQYQWTSSSLKKFEEEYLEKFGTSDGVPVSYVSSLVVAVKR